MLRLSCAVGSTKGGTTCPRAISRMSLATAARRCPSAGTGANEQDVAGEIAVDGDRVRDARDFRNGRVLVDEARRDAGRECRASVWLATPKSLMR